MIKIVKNVNIFTLLFYYNFSKYIKKENLNFRGIFDRSIQTETGSYFLKNPESGFDRDLRSRICSPGFYPASSPIVARNWMPSSFNRSKCKLGFVRAGARSTKNQNWYWTGKSWLQHKVESKNMHSYISLFFVLLD